MLKSKVFVKKTRRGKVVKIVREHYLRDDIWCGSKACTQCDTTQSSNVVLSDLPGSVSSLCDFNHYIILDTNAVLHQVCNCFFFVFFICYKHHHGRLQR